MKVLSAFAVMSAVGGFAFAPAVAQQAEEPVAADQRDHSGFYVGVGITSLWLDKDYAASDLPVIFADQPRLPALSGRLGYAFNEYFAVEADAAFGLESTDFGPDDDTVFGNLRQKSSFGAHAVATIPIGGGFYGLGRAGFSTFTAEREFLGAEAPDLEGSGASFGLGGGWRENDWDVRLEYNFLTIDEGDAGLFAINLLKHL